MKSKPIFLQTLHVFSAFLVILHELTLLTLLIFILSSEHLLKTELVPMEYSSVSRVNSGFLMIIRIGLKTLSLSGLERFVFTRNS